MSYFSEIILPPLEKVTEPNSTLQWWTECHDDATKFMVACPLCGEKYCYSLLNELTDPRILHVGIDENDNYYRAEWIEACPKQATHLMIISINKLMGDESYSDGRIFDWDY